MKLFTKKPHNVEFCDRCGSVCDDRCRSERQRERAVQAGIQHGLRIA